MDCFGRSCLFTCDLTIPSFSRYSTVIYINPPQHHYQFQVLRICRTHRLTLKSIYRTALLNLYFATPPDRRFATSVLYETRFCACAELSPHHLQTKPLLRRSNDGCLCQGHALNQASCTPFATLRTTGEKRLMSEMAPGAADNIGPFGGQGSNFNPFM